MAQEKKPKKIKKKPVSVKLARIFLRMFFWGAIASFIVAFIAIVYFSKDLPTMDEMRVGARRPNVTMVTETGEILATYGDLYEDAIHVNNLPPHVIHAVLSIEDHRFYEHYGIDIVGLVRAFYTNYKAQRVVQGGSTLTQQLAKNFLFNCGKFGVYDRSLKRKIQEVLLALWLEQKFSKNDILTLYLNRVYFGSGAFGINAAAQKYFNKQAKDLTVFEAAVIAGVLKAPSKYSFATNPDRARTRARVVLDKMAEFGYIQSPEFYLKEADDAHYAVNNHDSVRYFTDWVYENLPNYLGKWNQDLIITVTLNPTMQKKAEEAVRNKLEEMGKALKVSEVALVAIAEDGAVKAMVGGNDYSHTQFNRVTQARRQPGSAFKPFVYLAALESGMTPETYINDTPVIIGDWKPSNFKWKSQGEVSMHTALTKSVNAVTVRLAQTVGTKKIINLVRRLGINSDLTPDLSLALGSSEITLLELATAFSTFYKGVEVWPYGIIEIRNKAGDLLYSHEALSSPMTVIKEPYLGYLKSMLIDTAISGTARAAYMGIPILSKTGSNGDKDAWFIATTDDESLPSQLTVGIWAGNDQGLMDKKSVGGRLPAQLYRVYMQSIEKVLKEKTDTVSASSQSLDSFITETETTNDSKISAADKKEKLSASKEVDVPDLSVLNPTNSLKIEHPTKLPAKKVDETPQQTNTSIETLDGFVDSAKKGKAISSEPKKKSKS